jgi:hypothetical protein
MATEEEYQDLLDTLRWGSALPLTQEQRAELAPLCIKISSCVPSWRLKGEAEKRRALEKRVQELEAVLRNQRQEWVFRRKGARESIRG